MQRNVMKSKSLKRVICNGLTVQLTILYGENDKVNSQTLQCSKHNILELFLFFSETYVGT